MALILKGQRPSSRMAQSRKWPKLACSLHARLANVTFATRSPSERSLHARLAKQTFATSSPSEADRQQKISGFVLSPLGHEKGHYKYQHFSNEKGDEKQRETDENPGTKTLEATLETLKAAPPLRSYHRPTQSGSPIQGCNSIANRFALLLSCYFLNLHVIPLYVLNLHVIL